MGGEQFKEMFCIFAGVMAVDIKNATLCKTHHTGDEKPIRHFGSN